MHLSDRPWMSGRGHRVGRTKVTLLGTLAEKARAVSSRPKGHRPLGLALPSIQGCLSEYRLPVFFRYRFRETRWNSGDSHKDGVLVENLEKLLYGHHNPRIYVVKCTDKSALLTLNFQFRFPISGVFSRLPNSDFRKSCSSDFRFHECEKVFRDTRALQRRRVPSAASCSFVCNCDGPRH